MDKVIRRREPGESTELQATGLHPILSRVYRGRGVAEAAELELDLARLIPPTQLTHADTAASLLADSLERGERILVVGDYDADGATSTALALTALREFGAAEVTYLVPNRFEYGYGLSRQIVELALRGDKPDLIITVDNGISSIDGVAACREAGVKTLITDHHLAGSELPNADVIVNPNQPGCDFPSKNLAGVGVIFYIMLALRAELRKRDWFDQRKEPNLGRLTDLVSLGTVADVVPLDQNNRILVAAGLQRIRTGHARAGILALLEVAGRNLHSVVASDLGFAVGPRINAAGRLDDISVGIECLLQQEQAGARRLAAELHQKNQDRRLIEQDMQDQALAFLDSLPLAEEGVPVAMTLYQGDWHQGVIGILASRIKDRLHRPTIAFANGDAGEIKGSARSIAGIHIRDILDAVATRHPGMILKFGGHAMAAGLTIPADAYEAFNAAFVAEVERHAEDVHLQAVIESDGELQRDDFDLTLAEVLRYAGPWGQHFPEPVFDGEFRIVHQRLVGEKHLKLVLSPAGSAQLIDAIAFNIDLDTWPDETVQDVRLAYRLDVNEFRGRKSVQLMVDYIEALQS
ncbi:single-stranded-DNA-specific exonuclease RecJ [Halioglobus japonicus]|uniref:Single-stranded-DNA-specific exonuclease RecJ n=1 Tax=Halioglobus japonicus TaxID=930805 RepID=A0AAP8MH60_9GAMM|nr:single-stranded-DNA-specific exonuclease RecJ [Halioglobus japonicus]PLW87609.1 single-stranded-DNA-specific exonuclease RecJ [Halioglobus japonicus]GHD07559.1 single-stranded-DNA-specific exonuclease RecJ [Halioglobus japonicus]